MKHLKVESGDRLLLDRLPTHTTIVLVPNHPTDAVDAVDMTTRRGTYLAGAILFATNDTRKLDGRLHLWLRSFGGVRGTRSTWQGGGDGSRSTRLDKDHIGARSLRPSWTFPDELHIVIIVYQTTSMATTSNSVHCCRYVNDNTKPTQSVEEKMRRWN